MDILNKSGWNPFFKEHFTSFRNKGFSAARISAENKNNYLLITEFGEVTGEVTGKLLFTSDSPATLPKTGDWVVVTMHDNNSHAIIHEILPRRTKISRKSADRKTEEQVIAVNTDIVFIMQSLDENLNVNRLRRYLAAMYQTGLELVILLSKCDLDGSAEKIENIKKAAPENIVIPISSLQNIGVDEVKQQLYNSKTAVIIGSSGVGKSTLINTLLGEELIKVQEVRNSDSKGRHTTTRRELFLLPDGGIIIDTPGMRELALWNADEGIARTFSSFEELTFQCRFSDCTHTHETNCAVREAVENGQISTEEYENYLKLRKELNYLELRQNKLLQIEEKRKWKSIHKELKHFYKKNRG